MKDCAVVLVRRDPPGQERQPVQVKLATKLLFWIEVPSRTAILAPE